MSLERPAGIESESQEPLTAGAGVWNAELLTDLLREQRRDHLVDHVTHLPRFGVAGEGGLPGRAVPADGCCCTLAGGVSRVAARAPEFR